MLAFIVIVSGFNTNCILADSISNEIFVVQFILVRWVIQIFNNVFAFGFLRDVRVYVNPTSLSSDFAKELLP